MRALQQESQETPGQEGLTLVILNHTLTALWQRTAPGTNTDSSPKSIFPTGTISLWLIVLISSPAPFHSGAKRAVIATGGRGDSVPSTSDFAVLHKSGFQRGSFPVIPRGAESVQLANRRVLPFPLVFWDSSWGLLVSTGAWGAAVQSRNLSLQPPGLWFLRDQLQTDVLQAWREGIVSLFSFKVKLMSGKSMLPH